MTSAFESSIRSPLSPVQRDFLLEPSTRRGAAPHVLAASIDLGRDLDVSRWQEAGDAVFRSEPGMWLRVAWSDGTPWQVLDPQARLSTVVAHLDTEREPDLAGWMRHQLEARHDLESDSLYTHTIVRDRSGVWHAALIAPHVFIDGQGFRRFLLRTARIYDGEPAGSPPSIEPIFRAVERLSASTDLPGTLTFWRERLDGVSSLLFRTGAEPEGTDVDQLHVLSSAESSAVEAFCQARAVHPADFFLAVYAIVLERFREREGPWVVHTIRSAREEGEHDLMGCFYWAMPTVVGDLSLTTPISEVITRLRDQRRELRGRMQLSMLGLHDLLPRGGARAVFNYYNFTDIPAAGAVRQLRSYFFHRPDELHLVMARRPEGFELRAKFHTSSFSEHRLLPRLAAVAIEIAAGAETVGDCEWLLPDERGGTVRPETPVESSMVEVSFTEQATFRPDARALTLADEHLTYGELHSASNRLAHRLAAEGVGPDTLVAVYLDRSFEQVAAILAILKAGGAFVPIDPDYPEERVRFILEDSGATVLVGRFPDGDVLPASVRCQIPFQSVRTDFATESSAPPPVRATPESLAYVIYTSGSTGRPKGTLVTRRNLGHLFAAAQPFFAFGPEDIWALVHSCAFDFSVWETFGALVFGGRLVVVPPRVARSPGDLTELIDRERVTVLNQTPSAFFHLAAAPELEGSSLRYVIFGGEALETRRLARWFDRVGDASPRLVNMYGITETTVHVTLRFLTKADAEGEASPIGVALPGWDVYLVDPEGRLVPRGCSGEIWVGGAGVARGYLNRGDLTADRFLDDPFRPGPGRRVYRSGDLGRETPDGQLEFLGRIDDQVKIRGYRVELGEVAAVLAEHPTVRDAHVVAVPAPEGLHLVGYAISVSGVRLDEAELLRFLRRRLPAYMTCARVVEVDAFPLTAHGKLDRAALPVPTGRPPQAAEFVVPRTATEELVASLFTEATGTPRVGAEDDFFDLGGHSLAAMQVSGRLREVFQVQSGANLVFERPTVARLAEYVDAHRGTDVAADRPRFERAAERDALPVTSAQERVWLLQRLFPEMVAYNFEAIIRFRGRLDRERLSQALTHVVERHEAFRTTFHEVEERPVQRVHDPAPVQLEEHDFSALPPDEATRRAESLRRQIAARPFDPSRLPLVEWRLVTVSADEHLLLHREHHLIHDGWSFVVFVRDLLEVYRALGENRAPMIPASVAIGDYAAAHRRWIEGPTGAQQREYWESRLRGVPERLELPTDRPRPAVFSFHGDQLRFDLPQDVLARLRATARREGHTLYMLMLAAFALVLARLSGAEDLTVAAGVANRRWEEVENTIGMLLNNVVFRLRPRPGVAVREYLREVRAEVLGALANQDLPFDDIVSAAGVSRSPSETPLARTFFSSYEGPLPELSLPDLDVELQPGLLNGSAKFDWNVIVLSQPGRDGRDRVTVLWEYATDLFDRASMERARQQLIAAIDSLLESLDRPLGAVSISSQSERQLLLDVGAGSRRPYPRSATVHELFARQVAERPESVAVRDERDVVTYAELDRRAECVARGLTTRGVAPEEPIAFLLPRGVGAVTTMLGILKSGGAYLPLSPKDPPARLARLVREAGVRTVLTSEPIAETLVGLPASVVSLERLATDGDPLGLRPGAADALAAVLFTSGSTGQPKGVEVRHRGIVRLLFGADYATFGPRETFLQLAPLSFDASTLEIWGALLHGGTLVVFPDDVPSPAALGDAIARHGITTMWLNASLFNAIVDERAAVLSPLTQLLVGGEALSVAHVKRARQHLRDTVLINGYGPTENTTFSCCHEIPLDIDPLARSIPIGRPIAHSRALVLDGRGELAPAGAVGEIWVGGDGLARGYRNLSVATADAFRPDPFDGSPGARLYRTGDLGRVRPDGTLEFRGRRDSQIKIRGFRVEPGEIEAALRALTGVATVSVQPFDDPVLGLSLIAFVVPETGVALNPEGLRASLARELPPHLVPSRIVVRASLPTTPHGKLDTAMLVREARLARDTPETLPAAPRTALEGIITTACADVLGRDGFAANEDFFAAGGHSLLVYRVLARLDEALGVRVEPSVFLHGPTPRQLAQEIERRIGRHSATSATDVRSVVRVSSGARPLFLVPGGEGGDVSLAVYARLALHLPGFGFHGLRLVGDGVKLTDARTIEELAARFIEDADRIQPGRSYDLVGGCVGGIVAYEMARQLEQLGRPPRTLILLDTIYPTLGRRLRYRARAWVARGRRCMLQMLRVSGLGKTLQERLYERFSRLLPYDEVSPLVPLDWFRYIDMLQAYRPRPLQMPAVLLATQDLMATRSPDQWSRALGDRLVLRTIPGTHLSFMREGLDDTGDTVRDAIGA